MRMWMVDPSKMCRKHLLGEHVELHMYVGHLRLKRRVDRYVTNNLLETRAIESRHEELVEEMKRRGYDHKSPIKKPRVFDLPIEHQNSTVDRELALKELLRRCPECREMHK